jgi:DNA-nicking Smr family endonuclease
MSKKNKPFNNPFFDAGKSLKKKIKAEKQAKDKAIPSAIKRLPKVSEPDDDTLFTEAMGTVTRGRPDDRGRVTPALPPTDASQRPIINEDAESLAELASLIDDTGQYEFGESDNFVEGCAQGLDRRILRRLKAGDYPLGDRLDLHGLKRDEAHEKVTRFIERARSQKIRCVLIVHGKGTHSIDNIGILKRLVQNWLKQGRISRSVLAFCSAQPHDGGTGAVYVLLRR